MKYLKHILTLSTLLIITLVVVGVAAQDGEEQMAPEEVVVQFETAFNSRDYETLATLFTEDVLVTFIPAFFQSPIASREALLTQLEMLGESNTQVEIEPRLIDGDHIVIATTHTRDNETNAMGIDSLEFTEIYVVRDGLIEGITAVLADESLELAMAAAVAMESE